MKVADLIDDLEKGDRTMEHLSAKTPEGAVPNWVEVAGTVNVMPGSVVLTDNTSQWGLSNWGLANQQSQLANQLGQFNQSGLQAALGTGIQGGPQTWNR